MVERAGTGIENFYSKPENSEANEMSSGAEAPMFEGCSQVVANLVANRPMFEGVDTQSLHDMAFFAQNEIQERDTAWPPKERVDLKGFLDELQDKTGMVF